MTDSFHIMEDVIFQPAGVGKITTKMSLSRRRKLIHYCEILIKETIFPGVMYQAWAVYNCMPFFPPLINVVYEISDSAYYEVVPFYADYIFIEQADYHYQICAHGALVFLFSTTVFTAIDSVYLATVKHTCGLFNIICYRLENISRYDSIQILSSTTDTSHELHQIFIKIVESHEKAIQCCGMLENSFCFIYLIVQILVILMIAAGAHVIPAVFAVDHIRAIRLTSFYLGGCIHLLYLHWVGQQVINNSGRVFHSAYCGEWYHISLKYRKRLGLILSEAFEPRQLTAGKLSSFCMESYGKVDKLYIGL
ncbi:hypothetical protein QAD02_011407 [Eretmocerus hayati]|uniref:Uncharacterized protein n=1 Tax=Eretmocerus hayati TaxID=131215 RepID=A0ACC2NWU7_9HYME|nr:hypothetical protein QAD02_011407 [Eretmocerus hayati]